MRHTASLARKLTRTGLVLLTVALASIGLTLWVTWQLEGGAAAVNEAGRMRMLTWQLVSTVQMDSPVDQRQALVRQLDKSLVLLSHGEPSRPLFMPQEVQTLAHFQKVQSIWTAQSGQWLQLPAASQKESAALATELVAAIDQLVSAIEQQLARLTAILNLFQFLIVALAIGAATIMFYTGYQYVINPLVRLQQVLGRLEAGDFSTRIEVDTKDEFGLVAGGFNRMAGKLESLYSGLEEQVELKTRHIETQRAKIESLYEVSAFLASATSIEELSKGFAQRVRIVMKADAVAVRWSDEANQRYLMLASDCLPEDLLQEERSLLAGACACGNLTPDARTRVIPIISHEDAPVRHCARAGYKSLVSVPVRLQQRLIGEIDLFFTTITTLRSDEVELLDALASHLASALEGLRAAALEREAAVGQERALLASELHDSIAQSLAFLKIQVQLLRNASKKDKADQVQTALDELDAGLRESINDVRELLVHFRTRTNSGDIEFALQETLQKFEHQTGLKTLLQIQGEGLPLPADVQIQVLHVVQEALSNVRKHASATHVSVDVLKGELWRFTVRDNGIGFDTKIRRGQSHVGTRIMQERAARIGAQVEITSEHGSGTVVTLRLPAHPVSAVTTEATNFIGSATSGVPIFNMALNDKSIS